MVELTYGREMYRVEYTSDLMARGKGVGICFYCCRKRKTEWHPFEVLSITRCAHGDTVPLGTILAHRIFTKLGKVTLMFRRHCNAETCEDQYQADVVGRSL